MIEPKKLTEISKKQGLFKTSLIALFLMVSSTIFSADYYWVGNSGNWNDNSHWSLSSGGNGGAGVPTASDNVYFNQSSFSSQGEISINGDFSCLSLNVSSDKVVFQGSGDGFIGQSLNITTSIGSDFTGDFRFTSNTGSHQIKLGSGNFYQDLIIDGEATWSLASNALMSGNSISVYKGQFQSLGNLVACDQFKTIGSAPKNLDFSGSMMYIGGLLDIDDASTNVINFPIDFDSYPSADIRSNSFQGGVGAQKAVVNCGTFSFETVVTSNYNGSDVSCADSCDGAVEVQFQGGENPVDFTYTWFPNVSTSDTAFELCPRIYTVFVTEIATGTWCQQEVTVDPVSAVSVFAFSTTDVSCPGVCDGQGSFFYGGGTVVTPADYIIEWNDGMFNEENTANAINLCEGLNTLSITDLNQCSFDTAVTLVTLPLIVPNLTVYPVSCNNVCDGSIVSNPSGGNPGPYTFSWDNGALTPLDDSATGLCELTTYTVTVTDNNGCPQTASGTVPDRDSITITAAVVSNPTCFGFCDGVISLGISGGSGSYTGIDWAEGVLGGAIIPFVPQGGLLNPNNFCAGVSYKVYVTDANGCQDSLQLPMLTQPDELIMTVTDSTDLLCAGDADGFIDVTTVGGTFPYTHEWSVLVPPGLGGGEVTNAEDQFALDGGFYQVVATDFLNCADTIIVTVFEPDSIFINGIDIDNSCYDSLNACVDANVTGGMSPGFYSFDWAFNGVPGFAATEDICNLDSGLYTLFVVDTNGCAYDSTFLITTPGELFANATVTPASCNGGTGEICLVPANGTTPYEYDIPVNGTYDAVDCVAGLAIGSYNISVRDSNLCVKDSIVVISDPPAITNTMTPTNSTCNNPNGSATADPAGGTGPYTYQWYDSGGTPVPVGNGGTSVTISNVVADCYDVEILDANLCLFLDQVCIIDDGAPTGTFVTQDLTCFQSCNGSIVSTLSSGAPYVVSWSSSTYPAFTAATEDIFALCAGDYTITVTDANGCIFSEAMTITEPDQMMAGTSIITDVLCFGDSTGTIDITVTGGTVAGAYGYSWTGPGFTSIAEDLTLLAPGTYCVHVTDDNACFLDTCMVVNEPPEMVLSYTTVNAQCLTADGQATVTPTGGTPIFPPPNYQYLWPSLNTGATEIGLGVGNYTVYVTDDNSCLDSIVVAISEDGGPIVVTDSSYNISCNGICDGAIETSISTTSGNPYNLSWSGPGGYSSSAEDIAGLCAGTYILTATDIITGCQAIVAVVITEPAVFVIPGVVTDPTCFGQNGLIDITPTGGTTPYVFDWSNDGTLDYDDLEDLVIGAGTESVVSLDSNGCIATGTFTLTDPPQITYVTSNTPTTVCGTCDGTATATGAGGTPGVAPNEYTYLWTDGTGTQVGGSSTAIGLCAGCYDVIITDALGCTETTPECVPDGGAPPLVANATDVTCFGDTDGSINIVGFTSPLDDSLVWSGPQVIADDTNPALGLMPGTYGGQWTDNGCVLTTTVDVLEPLEITMTETLVNPPCAGAATGEISLVINDAIGFTSLIWTGGPTPIPPGANPATGLLAGTYTANYTDGNGCVATGTYTLNDNPTMVLTTSNVSTSCTVNDGQVSVVPTGGGPVGTSYTYSWEDSGSNIVGNTATVAPLGADTYTVTVTDDLLCTATATATVSTFNPPVITLVSQSDVTCFGDNDGSIFVNVSGGTTPPAYTFLWSPSGATTPNLTNVGPGYDTLTVTDGAGCTATLSDSIIEPPLLTVTGVVTDLTCNGDGSGAIDVTVNGGVTPYTYSWTGPGGFAAIIEDINGLNAGDYDMIPTDDNECTATYPGTVNEPTAIVLTTGVVNSTCLLNDGAASVNASGGDPGYSYSWTNVSTGLPEGGNNDTITNLFAGGYQCVVSDLSGCQDSVIVAVSDTTGPAVTSSVTNVVCDGDGNGSISLTISDPTPTIIWSGGGTPIPNDANPATGLDGGTYTAVVTASSGCVTTEIIVVGGPTGPISTTAVITDLTCYNDTSGAISVTTTGGTPSLITGYTFSWSGPGGFTASVEDIAFLDSGAYILMITDSNMCNYNITYNVSQPDSIAINPTVVDATCGVADGSIATAVTGGDGVYTYSWTDLTGVPPLVLPGNPSQSNLLAGIYEVLVTDGAGCTNLENVAVTDANGAPLTTVITNVTCNGNNDGTIALTINGPSTYTIDWSGPNLFTSALPSPTNLEPGTYNVLVTDNTPPGCVSALSVDILEPSVLTISGLDTSLSCFASMDGSIDITVSGGSPIIPAPDYTYSWTSTNSNFLPSPNLNEDLIGLDTGVYTVVATDFFGCTVAAQYTITQPASMLLASVVTNDNCFQGGNAAINITVTQGTTPYTYIWEDGTSTVISNNEDLTFILADTYTLYITDSNGCQKDTTFIVTEESQIIADVTVVDANCNFSDGSAVSNTSGGVGGYTYDWSPADPSITNSIVNQFSGVYPLTINDANGCQLDTTITISDIGGPTITIDNITDVTCFGASDGGIDVTVTGAGGYIYLWSPNPPSQVENLVNAPADVHTLQVTDALGCTSFETATISGPDEITATYTTVDATCGMCDGEATVTVAGGTPGYSYFWSSSPLTTPDVTGLCAGVHTVQITDFNNCVANVNVGVSNTGGPTDYTVVTTNVTCNGGADGTADVTPVGGTLPYTYYWPDDFGFIGNPISNLDAGIHFVEISDSNGCILVGEAIISESTVITSTALITPSTCGGTDGSIITTTSGGSGVYTYDWELGNGTGPDTTAAGAGIYSLTIDDGICTITEIYTIPGIGAPEIELSTAPTNCYNDSTGSIFSTVTNNVGIVGYQWFNGIDTLVYDTSDIINALPEGIYSVQILDSATMCYAFATTVITSPDSIVLSIPTIIDATCGGICDGEANIVASGGTLPYTYTWTGNTSTEATADSLCAGADTVTIVDAKFCTLSVEVIVNEPFPIAIIIDSVTDAFCVNTTDGEIYITTNGGDGNYTYSWVSLPAGVLIDTTEDITDLLPMDYELSITDGNGCSYIDTIPVDTLNILIGNAGLDSNVCAGSCIDLIGTAVGTSTYTLEWFDLAAVSQGTNDTLTICPATAALESYVLVATDLSCTYSDTVDVLVNPLPIVDAGVDYIEIFGTTVTLGGSPTANSGAYQWTPTTNFTDTSGTDENPEMMVNDNLEYVVTVTDSNGCINSDTVNVEIYPEILFPNGFSPNGDGINDTWQIDLMSEFPDAVIEVYNRWGQQLFISVGYVQQFDGTYKGEDLPVGTYYYIIVLNHPEYPDAYTGPITIMR